MYIITIILELRPDTDHETIVDYYENNIVQHSLSIPGVEAIKCIQLRSTPFGTHDTQPLRNLFYQIQITFSSEEAVDEIIHDSSSMNLLQNFIQFSKCKFHWFVGFENTFSPKQNNS